MVHNQIKYMAEQLAATQTLEEIGLIILRANRRLQAALLAIWARG